MKWFGTNWGGAVCEAREHVSTPVGRHCGYCVEVIAAGDDGVLLPIVSSSSNEWAIVMVPVHLLCMLRSVLPVIVHRDYKGFAICGVSLSRQPAPPLHYATTNEKLVTCKGCKLFLLD